MRRASLMVMVYDPSGQPLDLALITIEPVGGGQLGQATAESGRAEFDGIVSGSYSVVVVCPGYEKARQSVDIDAAGAMLTIVLRPLPNPASSGASGPPAMPVLAPKVQKLVTKALDALRAGKPDVARAPLEEAYRRAPGHPYINFLYGVYSSRTNDWPAAESYWQRALSIFPNHVPSLLFLSDALLREHRSVEAVPYLHRALEAAPTAWRAHALLAQALLIEHQYDDAVHEADRAFELGKTQAAGVRLLQARALVAQGNKERAIAVLQSELHDRPADSAAQKMLDSLRAP